MMEISNELRERCSRVRIVVLDCDGVMTDGRLYFGADGEMMKAFHVRDGQGISHWIKRGGTVAVVTGREGSIVRARADELGVQKVIDRSKDKEADLRSLLQDCGLEPEQAAFVGDDTGDIPAMQQAGVSFSVADGVKQVRELADIVTGSKGGRGAVREIIELLIDCGALA